MRFHHTATNLLITGGVDDIWQNSKGELIIVDYKATSKKEAVTLDAEWQIGYKRQMAIYGWLFRQNGFQVSSTGYFVYCNGITDKDQFDQKLEFTISLLPYTFDDSWVEQKVKEAHACLNEPIAPNHSPTCAFCQYVLQLKTKNL
jgi:CRISPR/Cas system-associated exonuclease Cas4 (RecB family)